MKLLTNSLSIRNFVAGHPAGSFKPCLISTASSREVFNYQKNSFYTSPLSRFVTVISAAHHLPHQLHTAQETAVVIVLSTRTNSILFSSSISTSKFWTLCDPPNYRGCVNHPPPTACVLQQDNQIKTVFIDQRLHERCSRPSYFLQNAWVVTKSVSKTPLYWHISLQNQCIERVPADFIVVGILQCDLITAKV